MILFATTCDGASHISSAVDIVLGTFRTIINKRKSEPSRELSQSLLYEVAQMMYTGVTQDGQRMLREHGLIFRPRQYRRSNFQKAENELLNYLASLVKEQPDS